MIKWFISLSNTDRISLIALIMSTISLSISFINLGVFLISRRKKIEINLISYRIVKIKSFYIHQFNVQILNKSQLPISIANINCNNISCPKTPHLIKEESYTTITKEKEYIKTMTFNFPINLSSLEGVSGFLEFKSKEVFDISNLNFKIPTNRGLIKDIEVNVSDAVKDEDIFPYTV